MDWEGNKLGQISLDLCLKFMSNICLSLIIKQKYNYWQLVQQLHCVEYKDAQVLNL